LAAQEKDNDFNRSDEIVKVNYDSILTHLNSKDDPKRRLAFEELQRSFSKWESKTGEGGYVLRARELTQIREPKWLSPTESSMIIQSAKKSLVDPDPKIREASAIVLGRTQNQEYLPVICVLLDDPERRVKLAALDGISNIARSLRSLNVYKRGDSSNFSRIQRDNDFKMLVSRLAPFLGHTDKEIRDKTFSVFGYLGKEGFLFLAKELNNSNPEARLQSLIALHGINEVAATDAIIGSLQDKDMRVREKAVEILSGYWLRGCYAQRPPPWDERVKVGQSALRLLDFLQRNLKSEDPQLRRISNQILENLVQKNFLKSYRSKTPEMPAMDISQAEKWLRVAKISTEIEWPTSSVWSPLSKEEEEFLKNCLTDSNKTIRQIASYNFSRARSVSADALIAALNDEDLEVRRNSAEALARIAERKEILFTPEMNLKIIKILEKTAAQKIKDSTQDAYLDEKKEDLTNMKIYLMDALKASKDKRAVKILKKLLKDPDPQVRFCSAEALAEITGESFDKEYNRALKEYLGK
jgi:HEAT repeat protein